MVATNCAAMKHSQKNGVKHLAAMSIWLVATQQNALPNPTQIALMPGSSERIPGLRH